MAQGSIGGFLPLSGGALTGALLAADGLVGTPSIAFSNSTGLGIWRRTADTMAFSAAGAQVFEVAAAAIKMRSTGVYGFSSTVVSGNDAGFSRVGAAVVALGNGTAGNTTGTLQANIQLSNAYVVGAVVGTGSVTIKDSTGTTYRVPVLV